MHISEISSDAPRESLPHNSRGSNSDLDPDNRQTQGASRLVFGNIATSIQAAVMPTHQQKIQQLEGELKQTRAGMHQMAQYIKSLERERQLQLLKEVDQRDENKLSVVHREFEDAENLKSIHGEELMSVQGSLKEAEQSLENELSTVRRELEDAKNELHKTQGQLGEARGHLDGYARELKRTQGEVCQLHHINGLEHEHQYLEETNQSCQNKLSTIRRELDDAKNLASIRGKELMGAQVFLTNADALSISEVIEKVTNLNEEIFQAAALLGEALVHEPHDVSDHDLALGIAEEMIGSKIVNILREESRMEVPEANPVLVQVVLQVFLVSYCSQLIQSWSNDATCASHLAAIHSRIRDKEEQAVSGRWRALTRRYTRPALVDSKGDLLRMLSSVLRVASWVALYDEPCDAFGQKLEFVFRAVEDLRDALGEKFTSADLEVSVMQPDLDFKPAYMEDAYGNPGTKYAPQEVVAGTTGIGLKKPMLKRSATGEVAYENVLSPKVVLESMLLKALRLPPPRTSRKRFT